MNTIAKKLEERLTPLKERIEKLEQCLALEGINAIAERSAEEDDIMRQINALMKLATQAGSVFSRNVQKKLQGLVARLSLLPSVPRIESVKLAQNILALNPVMLVTDDTIDETHQRPELTRIFLMEPTGTACFDYQFPSFSDENEGLLPTNETVDVDESNLVHASLEKALNDLQNVLLGHYVIAFDLSFVQIQLAVTAQRYGLPVPMLIGHSLLDLLLKYTRVKDPIDEGLDQNTLVFTDTQLCDVLAKEDIEPFTDLALAPADQRALHMLHALQAIANATFSLQEPLPISSIMPFDGMFVDPFSEDEV
jgi:hypothetical protein